MTRATAWLWVRRGVALLVVVVALTSCGWRGIANVPVPGGPGGGPDANTIYVQMPDTLGLNVNSRVKVADVDVGSVRAIKLKNWTAILTLRIRQGVKLPANATAKIGQTSLLGSQHLELAAPENPSSEPLRNGDTIPLKNSSAYPTTEQVLASLAMILRGGGIENLDVIQDEIYKALNGRADQIREFLNRLDTFTDELNAQRDDIARAVDSTNRLLAIVANNNATLDRVLTEIPPLIQHFADTRKLFTDAVEALGRLSKAADDALAPSGGNLHTNLQLLQRPLCELKKAAPFLLGAAELLLSAPFNMNALKKVVRGDFINGSALVDLTLSRIDNAVFTGTGVSGMLRALEQSWGRDPATMVPDVRFTPNAHDAPNGPLVERGNGIC